MVKLKLVYFYLTSKEYILRSDASFSTISSPTQSKEEFQEESVAGQLAGQEDLLDHPRARAPVTIETVQVPFR